MKKKKVLAVNTHHLKQASTFIDVAMKAPNRTLARNYIHQVIRDLLEALEDNSKDSL